MNHRSLSLVLGLVVIAGCGGEASKEAPAEPAAPAQPAPAPQPEVAKPAAPAPAPAAPPSAEPAPAEPSAVGKPENAAPHTAPEKPEHERAAKPAAGDAPAPAKPASAEPSAANTAPAAPPAAANAQPATPAPAAATGPCGEKNQPKCPLQAWMEKNLQDPLDAGDLKRVAASFTKLARFSPDASWNAGATGWSAIANSAATAAGAGDAASVKQACKSCHKTWRSKYKATYRTRPIAD